MSDSQFQKREEDPIAQRDEAIPFFRHNGITMFLLEKIRYYVGLSGHQVYACKMEKGGAPVLSTFRMIEDLRDWYETEIELKTFIARAADRALVSLVQQSEHLAAAARSLITHAVTSDDGTTVTISSRHLRILERSLPESE